MSTATEQQTTTEAHWPLDAVGLHKGALKAKAERHAVFEQPEREWLWEALQERRTSYTLDEIRAMDMIVFTSSDLSAVENPEDYHPLRVHAAQEAEKKDNRLAQRVSELHRVDELVAALGEGLVALAERTGGDLPGRDEVSMYISMQGADVLRERGVDEEKLRRLTELWTQERETLVEAVRETARHAGGLA
jgi:hypothetical protein